MENIFQTVKEISKINLKFENQINLIISKWRIMTDFING
jgi:hypothetical protein